MYTCRVNDLDGKDYRLLQNNLDKDIVADESKILVKKDKVVVKLQKVTQPPWPCPCRDCLQMCRREGQPYPPGSVSHARAVARGVGTAVLLL